MKKCESLEKYYKDEKDKVWGIKLSNYYDFWPDDKSFNEEFTECMKKVLDGYDVLTYSEGGLVILNAAALRYRLDGYALIK